MGPDANWQYRGGIDDTAAARRFKAGLCKPSSCSIDVLLLLRRSVLCAIASVPSEDLEVSTKLNPEMRTWPSKPPPLHESGPLRVRTQYWLSFCLKGSWVEEMRLVTVP